jgi:hypothetical protein
MGFSSSDSEQEQGGDFSQDVWSGQAPFLTRMYGQFNNLFPWTTSGMQRLTPEAVSGAQNIFQTAQPFWQQQMTGGAYGGQDFGAMYQDALQGGGAEQEINQMIMGGAGNDYADAMKQEMQSDAFDRLGTTLSALDLRSGGTNLPGSSRHGIVQARAVEDEMDRLGKMQTGIGYETFDKDLQRKLDIARRADAFDATRLGSISDNWARQQAAQQGGIGMGANLQALNMGQFAPYMMPWQGAGAYANAMGAPVVLGQGSSFGAGESGSTGVSFK